MNESLTAIVEVPNRLGMHARAAAKLVEVANRFRSHIEVSKDGKVADTKSIMGVLLLCCHRGAKITFRATGPDAAVALTALCELVDRGFGEER